MSSVSICTFICEFPSPYMCELCHDLSPFAGIKKKTNHGFYSFWALLLYRSYILYLTTPEEDVDPRHFKDMHRRPKLLIILLKSLILLDI